MNKLTEGEEKTEYLKKCQLNKHLDEQEKIIDSSKVLHDYCNKKEDKDKKDEI